MAEFTTGEAVAVELPIARIPTRATAFLIDLIVQAVLGAVLVFVIATTLLPQGLDKAWTNVALLVTLVLVLAGYPIACETALRGRTAGKLIVGLRVVRADGGPIDFRHALTRGLTGAIVDFWMLGGFGIIAVLTSLCSPEARRVGDVLAGTLVVHDRQSLPLPALVTPPPWLTQWAGGLTLADVPDDLARSVRQYLTRTPTLTPRTQHELGVALVIAVCGALRVAAPQEYPPVQILGAVLAERQRRALPLPPPVSPVNFGAVVAG
ncbi:RDD family protein [Nocardia callitridis]|uniref:RDD family protein n=1 Tax=Nocardia callitridis TaxID=648753 RepID=A0ABP9JXZ7_9NOCA